MATTYNCKQLRGATRGCGKQRLNTFVISITLFTVFNYDLVLYLLRS